MIFKIDNSTKRADLVFLAPGVNEKEYFSKYEKEDNLIFVEKLEKDVNVSGPLVFENGKVLNDISALNLLSKINLKNLKLSFLERTDVFMISDFPISEIDKNELIKFRQNIRDLQDENDFPLIPKFLQERGFTKQ